MTDWKMAMFALIPLMSGRQKLRTWAAVLMSSILAMLVSGPEAYIVIDLICGLAVLTKPAGAAQRAIGLLFAGMLIVDVGYAVSPQLDGGMLYYRVLSALGWLQWAILAAWGLYDVRQAIARRLGPPRRALADQAGAR